MSFERSLMIFRRDLRLHDNTALRKAVENSGEVVFAFIFDDRQCTGENEYLSSPGLQFLVECLDDLKSQLSSHHAKLHILHGQPEEVVADVIDELAVDAVFVNEDVTPFSRKRDKAIKQVCHDADVAFVSCHDLFLTRPGSVRTNQDTPYKVFTPFMRSARERQVPRPQEVGSISSYDANVPHSWPEYAKLVSEPRELFAAGGRSEALKILDSVNEHVDYTKERDVPALDATTGLSAYHKFGCVSVRETYHAVCDVLGADHTIISQLYWRDFFSHVAYDFPEVFGQEFREKYRVLEWGRDEDLFEKWCSGLTGFPIVDAGMRQLNESGYMHNRVRMIVASFLTKDLRLDWRLGEKYFAQQLIDYDPAVNNGSWQWAASTGCDAQPYFRIFNPWSQQKKYDPDAEYIKRWIPELRDVDAKMIHKLADRSVDGYPEPMVDHSQAREETLAWFKSVV